MSHTKNNIWTAVILAAFLLCSVVGFGWLSVDAEGSSRSVSTLWVKKAPDGFWRTYEGDVRVDDYTGIAKNEYGWWRVVNGKVDFNATGLYKNEYGWWRVEKGKVNFDANGFYKNQYGYWWVQKGKVQMDYSGAKKGTIQKVTAWWRVEGGHANTTYKGIAKNEYGWWYFEDGKVDFDHTGVDKNDYGWWRVENGKVNFDYNGVASNQYGSWYIVNGKVDFSYSGAFVLDGTMYVVEKGKVVASSQYVVSSMPATRATVTNTNHGATLSWTAVKGVNGKAADGYEIYMKSKPTGSYSKVATVDGTTTSYNYEFGMNIDPTQNTRLYDVRAIQKDSYGLVSRRSPEMKQTEANHYLGGAFGITAPSIVSLSGTPANMILTFKTVPYATKYIVYLGRYDAKGNVSDLKQVKTVKANNSGSGSAESAKTGWVKGNQSVTFKYPGGYQFVTVKATYSESAANGYTAVDLESDYDVGFQIDRDALTGRKILFMGDSLIAGTPYGPSTSDYTIATRVAQQTGATTYNSGVGGAVIVSDYPRIINNSILKDQNMTISDGSYEKIKDSTWTGVSSMADFDTVILEGGPNDFFKNVTIGSLQDSSVKTFLGAYQKHMTLLKEASQKRLARGQDKLTVVLIDMIYTPKGYSKNTIGLDYDDYSNAYKTLYQTWSKDPDLNVYLFNGFSDVLNAKNYETQTVDNLHPTAFRYGLMGNSLARYLEAIEASRTETTEETTEPSAETAEGSSF